MFPSTVRRGPMAECPEGARFWRKPFWVGVVASALLCLTTPASAGTVTITMVENSGSISVSLSGSIDYTTNAGVNTSALFSNYIAPVNGTIGFGLSTALVQAFGISNVFAVQSASPAQTLAPSVLFSPYGTGPYVENALSGVTGDLFFIYTNGIGLARDYVSGAALSATGTLTGTFATNGITVGTSTTQFTLSGFANTVIVQRSVPTPAATGLLGAALAALGLVRMRTRRAARVG